MNYRSLEGLTVKRGPNGPQPHLGCGPPNALAQPVGWQGGLGRPGPAGCRKRLGNRSSHELPPPLPSPTGVCGRRRLPRLLARRTAQGPPPPVRWTRSVCGLHGSRCRWLDACRRHQAPYVVSRRCKHCAGRDYVASASVPSCVERGSCWADVCIPRLEPPPKSWRKDAVAENLVVPSVCRCHCERHAGQACTASACEHATAKLHHCRVRVRGSSRIC